MIFHQATLENFGIYAGEHHFDLLPQNNGRFQFPIVLLRGQNGVGKSTLMEAIRLGLHGRLSLGNRTTQKEYETYLEQRQHRSVNRGLAFSSSVQLVFEHVSLGHRRVYRVKRTWSKQNNHLAYNVQLWIDDKLNVASGEESDHLLRELMPLGVTELFFFDGEKINTLSDGGQNSDVLLGETIKNLLGLHLVEQLDRDLDIYLTRQTSTQTLQRYQIELSRLSEEFTNLEEQKREIQSNLGNCYHCVSAKREAIGVLETRIVHEGGEHAAAQRMYAQKREQLIENLACNEQEIFELSRGVMPFAVAPRLLRSVRYHLEQEARYEGWQAAQPILEDVDMALGQEPNDLSAVVTQVLDKYRRPPIPEKAVIHRVIPEARGVLLNWIDEALTITPKQLAGVLRQRERLQGELKTVEDMLRRVPLDQLLQPLQDELRQHERELGRLEADLAHATAEDRRLTVELERITASKRSLSEQIVAIATDERRIELAARTKLLLNDYQERLIARKLEQFEGQLAKRFNQLSRKRGFIDRIEIDPHHFSITLYRSGKMFPRNQLSAGEQQVFAIATLWALREVSGRPLPVIIDTPLSRLDDLHRRAMLTEFMPQVSQQVIVLATNVEIDEQALELLRPALSHVYLLEADSNATQAILQKSVLSQMPFVALSEVVA